MSRGKSSTDKVTNNITTIKNGPTDDAVAASDDTDHAAGPHDPDLVKDNNKLWERCKARSREIEDFLVNTWQSKFVDVIFSDTRLPTISLTRMPPPHRPRSPLCSRTHAQQHKLYNRPLSRR